jgi:hypothetical protein
MNYIAQFYRVFPRFQLISRKKPGSARRGMA